jgi:hypothetical protein
LTNGERDLVAFAFRVDGCSDPPPTTFEVSLARARDSQGELDDLAVMGAAHVLGGRLDLPTYEPPEHLQVNEHIAQLYRDWEQDIRTPRMLRGGANLRYPGDPSAAALAAIRDRAGTLRIDQPQQSLRVTQAQRTPYAWVVNIDQVVNDVPVYSAGLTVVLSDDGELLQMNNSFMPSAQNVPASPVLSADDARRAALREVGLPANTPINTPQLMMYAADRHPELAWSVGVRDWMVFISALTGQPLGVQRAWFFGTADAPARVWLPNPRVAIGDTTWPSGLGCMDCGRPDTTCSYPPGVYQEVLLHDVTEVTPGTWRLEGPRTKLEYINPPDAFTSASPPDFRAFRCTSLVPPIPDPQGRFHQALAYFLVDRANEYLYGIPGITRTGPIPMIVRYGGGTNYDFMNRQIITGTSTGTEDAELLLHEYGHAFHHDQTNLANWSFSTPEGFRLTEGGIGNFVATSLVSHQRRDISPGPPFEWLLGEWHSPGPGGGPYIRNNTLYPWHWADDHYKAGNIFNNALMSVFDAIEGPSPCGNVNPTTFIQPCAARDSVYRRLAHALKVTGNNQWFRTVAEGMMQADRLVGGPYLDRMMDVFDRHGWFFTEHDPLYGVSFTPRIIPADADSATRTLALELFSVTGIKPASVFVHYGALGAYPHTLPMVVDPGLGPNTYVAFLNAGDFDETFLNYYVTAVNEVNGPTNPGVTSHWPKSAPELDHAKFWVGTTLERIRFASSAGADTIPAGQTRTLTIVVTASPTDVVQDVNLRVVVPNAAQHVPMANWSLQRPQGQSARLIFNLYKDQVSWPSSLDIWFDDEKDAAFHHFPPWSFDIPPQPTSLAQLDGAAAAGQWKLIIDNGAGSGAIILADWEVQITTQLSPVAVQDMMDPGRTPWVGDPRPNPFNATVSIPMFIAADDDVAFRVYDVAGRLVRVLIDERMVRGSYVVKWDGRNDRGLATPSGVYFYRVDIGDREFRGKAMILK